MRSLPVRSGVVETSTAPLLSPASTTRAPRPDDPVEEQLARIPARVPRRTPPMTPPPRSVRALLVLAAGVALVACGDDAEDASQTGAPDAAEVEIERSRYEPPAVTVAVGGEVTFTNLDAATHTVTAKPGGSGSFDSGDLAESASFSQTFDTAGTYRYICEIHPTMEGTVEVVGP